MQYLVVASDAKHPKFNEFRAQPWFVMVYTIHPKEGQNRFQSVAKPIRDVDVDAVKRKFADKVDDGQILILAQAATWSQAKRRARWMLHELKHKPLTGRITGDSSVTTHSKN